LAIVKTADNNYPAKLSRPFHFDRREMIA
jgi:hypothetical protein